MKNVILLPQLKEPNFIAMYTCELLSDWLDNNHLILFLK